MIFVAIYIFIAFLAFILFATAAAPLTVDECWACIGLAALWPVALLIVMCGRD